MKYLTPAWEWTKAIYSALVGFVDDWPQVAFWLIAVLILLHFMRTF